ncbi:MAG: hypothetical protein IH591_15460 [Bacteroidales bacterium]|nr:hypothetical protein [Bacteroidales bacterium]
MSPVNAVFYESGTKRIPLIPGWYFRFGRRDLLDLKYEYGMWFPAQVPVLSHEISLGSGLGSLDVFNLRVGFVLDKFGFSNKFISINGLAGDKLALGLRYNFGKSTYGTAYDWFSLNAGYRFGYKLKPVPHQADR